jgi:hypothetical protein
MSDDSPHRPLATFAFSYASVVLPLNSTANSRLLHRCLDDLPSLAVTALRNPLVLRGPVDTVVHSDRGTGEGLFVLPRQCHDLTLELGQASLHAADELAVLAQLDALGWELSQDEHGEPAWVHVGWTEDGREAFALYGREPITTTPTLAEQATAMDELRQAAGLVQGAQDGRP